MTVQVAESIYKTIAVLIFVIGGMFAKLVFDNVEYMMEVNAFTISTYDFVKSFGTPRGLLTGLVVGVAITTSFIIALLLAFTPGLRYDWWKDKAEESSPLVLLLAFPLFCLVHPILVPIASQVFNGGVGWVGIFTGYQLGTSQVVAMIPTFFLMIYSLYRTVWFWEKK